MEFSNPKLSVSTSGIGFCNVFLECSGISTVIPMNGNVINGTVGARCDEVFEPSQTHWRSTVGDSGRNKLGLSRERFHVGHPSSSSVCVSNVRLGSKIGLVESEEMT